MRIPGFAAALALLLTGCAADVPQIAGEFGYGSSGYGDDGFYDGGVFDQDLMPEPGGDEIGGER